MKDMYPSPRLQGEARSRRNILVSVAVPALNESENLPTLCAAVREVLERAGCRFELVIADNGSSDNSLEVLDKLSKADPRVRYLALSRNFGHQGGLIAALEHARGDVVISMDADLQHPPAAIPDLLSKWEEGYDVVNTRKRSEQDVSVLRSLGNRVYYWIVSHVSGIPMQDRQSDYRLLDRRALDALLALPEKNKYLRGLSHWIGFVHVTVPYDAAQRHAGKSHYGFASLLRFAADGLVSFSVLPLRMFTFVGTMVALGALLYGGYIFIYWLLDRSTDVPVGWASLAVGIYFIGGVQLIGIGVLGEYIARTYDETRSRPSYILRRSADDPEPPKSAD